MKPLLPVLAVAAVITGAYAVQVARAPTKPPPAAPQPAPAPRPARTTQAPSPIADAVQRALEPPPEPEKLQQVVGRSDAEVNFEGIMQSLEALADKDERLPRARREELYRNVNDAFAGLSAVLDPNDARDMQTLEDANIRMKAMMQELGIRVPLRPPPPAP